MVKIDNFNQIIAEGRELLGQYSYATDYERYKILLRNKTISDGMTEAVQSLILFPEYVEPSTGQVTDDGLKKVAYLQRQLNKNSNTMRVGSKIWIDPETNTKHKFDIHLKNDEDLQKLVERDNAMILGWTNRRDRDSALLNKGREIREEEEKEEMEKLVNTIQGRHEPPLQRRRRKTSL